MEDVGSESFEIRVEGIVQGVGFRPFIYRLATEMNLKGFVRNDTEGVLIGISGGARKIRHFIKKIHSNSPPLSLIKKIDVKKTSYLNFKNFKVVKSEITGKKDTFIPPDTALCSKCKDELFDEKNCRYHYPFITCTHCGPRFSIIKDIPYDRKNTAMADFKLCQDCIKEYENPLNRRFHTEPTSCSVCGPKYFLKNRNGIIIEKRIDKIVLKVVEEIERGSIVAIKGVGGFHLACDAKNHDVVKKLRERKKRPFKPFAVMAGTMDVVKNLFELSDVESSLLETKERPIVILKNRKRELSDEVAPGLTFTGVMLPYSPLQLLLFNQMKKDSVLVMTSGNISDEPIVYDEEILFEKLGNIADLFVVSDREIIQHSDDSVVSAVNKKYFFIRRSRGFVPVPLFSEKSEKTFFASGADLKNSFAVAKEDKIFLSQYIGDLESPLTEIVFEKTVEHFEKIFDVKPDIFISDMHPGYFSSKIADKLSKGKKRVKVQHHHAHIASVLEENSESEKVIGLAFDGTGYGTDGKIWGSEFLIADKKEFKRAGHLSYFRLPGGEAAIKEVKRVAHSLLYETFGKEVVAKYKDKSYITELLDKNINSPQCCSIGRLFDGISSLLGFSDVISTEAEAAQLLEEGAMRGKSSAGFNVDIKKVNGEYIMDSTGYVRAVFEMMERGIKRDDIAYSFHISLVNSTLNLVEMLRNDYKIEKVALSGGVFQNRLLLSLFLEGLEKRGFTVLLPNCVPFNDGCIALGQIAIAKEIFK